jgi:large subunit ribosomal protein L32e
MPQPIIKQKPTHKRTKKFHRFQSDQFKRLKPNWRKPRGIDNPLRRHYAGRGAMPSIGFGANKTTKYMRKNRFIDFVVHNEKELEALLMQNGRFQAVIASTVSARNRIKLIERARQLDIKVTNPRAKLKTEENE